MKQNWKPGTMIYPLPALMVSCGTDESNYNVFTASWVGTICSDPPMCYVSIRPSRHSYQLIKDSGEFVLNLTTKEMAFATDWVGVRSGKKYNKWEEMSLTPLPGREVKAPIIKESPLSIECKVKQIIPLGTHDMFIAEVVNVVADDRYIDPQTETFRMDLADLLVYQHGNYYQIGEKIGKFGWSVEKKKKK